MQRHFKCKKPRENHLHKSITAFRGEAHEKLNMSLHGKDRKREKFSATFTTGPFADYWTGIVKNPNPDSNDKGILSIDNIAIDPMQGVFWLFHTWHSWFNLPLTKRL